MYNACTDSLAVIIFSRFGIGLDDAIGIIQEGDKMIPELTYDAIFFEEKICILYGDNEILVVSNFQLIDY